VSRYFTNKAMTFLRKLERNNNRDWFNENKDAYEETVRHPALQFIEEMADDLAKISPHFLAQPKKVGGSLMRVHRDVRFSKDKRPYKTNIGIQFRHELGKDVHAPGFYVHVEPGDCFIGVGIWRPDAPSLGKIRDVIAETPNKWKTATGNKTFNKHFKLSGESLSRPPRGYDKNHPLVEDLKRKDFIAIAAIDNKQVLDSSFKRLVVNRFKAADNYMNFLCNALNLQY
jgi:uncharacterized protein (TIGR02453 family)